MFMLHFVIKVIFTTTITQVHSKQKLYCVEVYIDLNIEKYHWNAS